MAGLKLDLKSRNVYVGAVVISLALIGLAGWWFGQERLPGYNIDPVYEKSYVEPSGRTSEYFTGVVEKLELSIVGWKMTVTLDGNSSERTFLVPADTPIWLGLVIGEKTISGREKVTLDEIEKDQRVAVFIGKNGRATRVNILKR